MKIIYELNPPKIIQNISINIDSIRNEIDKFIYRSQILTEYVNDIHITDSVLGIPRISSLQAAAILMKNIKLNEKLSISCSIRTRDRNINSLIQSVTESVFLKITDLLLILGDTPILFNNELDSKILSFPTNTLKILNSLGFDKLINLNLSIPNKNIEPKILEKKINSKPYGMVTQSINTLEEVKILKKLLNPHSIKLIPCIMIPSEKNERAAKIIGLDWKEYKENVLNLIIEVGKITNQILITSPNDFYEGVKVLKQTKELSI